MIRFASCAIVAGLFTWLCIGIYTAQVDSMKHNITYNTAEVVSVGQCVEKRCSFTYKTSFGEVRNGITSDPVSVGQVVYQECWTEKKRGNRCYVEYTPSQR